jgi:hydroxymethylglutaryl-CoA reductase
VGVASADGLASVIAAVQLAQNFAALRALVTRGITPGRMKIPGMNVACQAGATGTRSTYSPTGWHTQGPYRCPQQGFSCADAG